MTSMAQPPTLRDLSMPIQQLDIQPLTLSNWSDFEDLFGKGGAYCGCWCMYWRLTRRVMEANGNAGNKLAMHELIKAGTVPGILAYQDGRAVGWCAVAPRAELASLNRSPVLKQPDDKPVWSITCLFAAKSHRGVGISEALIRGAIEHVKAHEGRIVEAYPHAPVDKETAPVTAYMGFPSIFEQVGFQLVRKASKARWIMRYHVADHA